MRKLILMAQLSLDGYIADKTGNSDWLIFNWGEQWTSDFKLRKYFTGVTSSADCMLFCPAMAKEGYISHWAEAAKAVRRTQSAFANNVTASKQVIFSKTVNLSEWMNTDPAKDEISDKINKLKKQDGKNIIVYGGASFVRALISAGLIDEFQLFVDPKILGSGINLFSDITDLKLMKTRSFPCGVTLLKYVPLKLAELVELEDEN